MSEPADTPLFPLGVVLFPTQPLPLRIFEERYKLMISECLEQNAGFGVVLIKQGREVGGPAAPFEVGTMAKIIDAQRFPDGRYNLQTVGETPFRLRRVTQMRPYMRGEIEPLLAATYPLADLRSAQEAFIAKNHVGNIAVTMG